jgi:glycosyltransferase involved in cell wall biosynthesis
MTRLVVIRETLEDRELANYVPLRDLGYDLSFVTTHGRGPYDGSGLGVPVHRLRQPVDFMGSGALQRAGARAMAPFADPRTLIGLERLLRDGDVVCVNETHTASASQACLAKRRNPSLHVVVVSYENVPFRYEHHPEFARRKDLVRGAADRFIALTPEAEYALQLEGVSSDRIVLQPYGVDRDRFSPTRRDDATRAQWGADPTRPVVLFAGRFVQEKGLANLLMAIARAEHECSLVLVGGGGEEQRLRRMVTELRLADRVRFAPWAAASEMPRIMASADLFVMPSLPTPYWEEQLGFSLIEAMASAVPVLTTRSGSIPFVVGDGGAFVEPYDVDVLAGALDDLLADPGRRATLGAAGRARVETDLDVGVTAPRLAALLRGSD